MNDAPRDDAAPVAAPDPLEAIRAELVETNDLLRRVLAEVATTPSTHAVFVDAGYVYAAAGRLVVGTEDRKAFDLDAELLIEALIDKARSIFPDSRLLRVYWYDGARQRVPTVEQRQIAELPDVKVRLGNLNAHNQQKGVDSLIRGDLESLARHRAISDAVLISGDEDLVSVVEAAQAYGARVHLWGIEAVFGKNQADPLLWEVDSQRTFDLEFCRPYLAPRPQRGPGPGNGAAHPGGWPSVGAGPGPGPVPTRDDVRFVGARVAAQWLASRGRDNLADLLPNHPYLPGTIDQELLVEAEGILEYSLRGHGDLRRALRDGFWDHLQQQF
ncbi:NYN domain containing protein [Wenjunlia vitaminophila]|uniref:NYN domain containing protein n=1 Tax=Wenjunlia vitaminophila TaxID=76728 RepID=A0A0T6LMD0_WENVI|nr:NYN domain-containing protein [Wenjunlia vitaminophila]KRV47089.1 NYN domain containing protein [Wenjunlia vitaminophila]